MHQRVAVALRGRCHHEFRIATQCRFKCLKRPIGTHAQRRDAMLGVIHRAGWAGEVKHIVQWTPFAGLGRHLSRQTQTANHFADDRDCQPPGQQIVGRDDRIAIAQQSIAQDGSRESQLLRSPARRRICMAIQDSVLVSITQRRRQSILRSTLRDVPRCNKRIRDRPSLADHTDSAHRAQLDT